MLVMMVMFHVVCAFLGVDPNAAFAQSGELNLEALAIFSLIFGMTGSIISLLLSKTIAKWSVGAKTIDGTEGEAERWLVDTVRTLAERANVPVALHLDHGSTERQAADALAWGYTSVMFDGSRLSFDENAARTKAVADAAHAAGATCEGEIGHVAMGDETALTEPDEAAAFAKASGVDALAVSIGTAHGYYKAEPKLDIPRCAAIADALPDTPLVLHGGSGTPLADVRRAIESGIAKVNIATEFLDGYIKSTLKVYGDLNGAFVPPDKLADPIIDACAEHVRRLVRFFAGR